MSGFTLPTSRPITQAWAAEFDDWDGDGDVDYPGGFYNSIGWDGHNGIDYGCHEGDPIEAVADGVVAYADWAGDHWLLSGGGIAVLLEHPQYGIQSEYLHLSRTDLVPGQRVRKGQVIGYGGSTGASTAPHLHLGILPLAGINLNNRMRGRIDPTPFLYGPLNPDYAPKIQAAASPLKGFLMALSDKQQTELYNRIIRYVDSKVSDVPKRVWGMPVRRGGKQISALQELADAKTLIIKQQATIDALTAKVNAQQAVTK